MREGFDVGLEMSGNGPAFKSMIANMCHGGKIALLGIGIHGEAGAIDWDAVVFNGLDDQGHLRTRDVRNLVQDDRHDPERPGHFAGHHSPLLIRAIPGRLRTHALRQKRQDRSRLVSVAGENLTQSRKAAKGGRNRLQNLILIRVCFFFLCGFAALREVFCRL